MIQIGSNYWILDDEYSFMVARKQYVQKGKNKGDIRWVDKTYHSTMEQLRDRISCLGLRAAMKGTALELMTMIDSFILQEKEIKNLRNKKNETR